MTERDVEVEGPFAKSFGQRAIVRVVEMVVQLEADSQDGIRQVAFSLSHLEERLAELAAQAQRWTNLRRMVLVPRIVKLLTEFPTRFPSLLASISAITVLGMSKRPFSMNVAQPRQRVAERPTFAEREPERGNIVIVLLKSFYG